MRPSGGGRNPGRMCASRLRKTAAISGFSSASAASFGPLGVAAYGAHSWSMVSMLRSMACAARRASSGCRAGRARFAWGADAASALCSCSWLDSIRCAICARLRTGVMRSSYTVRRLSLATASPRIPMAASRALTVAASTIMAARRVPMRKRENRRYPMPCGVRGAGGQGAASSASGTPVMAWQCVHQSARSVRERWWGSRTFASVHRCKTVVWCEACSGPQGFGPQGGGRREPGGVIFW